MSNCKYHRPKRAANLSKGIKGDNRCHFRNENIRHTYEGRAVFHCGHHEAQKACQCDRDRELKVQEMKDSECGV